MPLPKLIGRQKEVVYLPAQGHCAVLGTAGSGKTAMAIYRAAHLAQNCTNAGKKVLLVTFNKTLTKYLRAWAGPSLPINIDIETYHHFALGYLSNVTGKRLRVLDDKGAKRRFIEESIEQTQNVMGQHEVFENGARRFPIEFEWMEKVGISSLEDYLTIEKYGGDISRIPQEYRPIVYASYEKYRAIRDDHGFQYDWDDIANEVVNQFTKDTNERWYQHIIVDEGQDFSVTMLRSLIGALPTDGSFTFFGDIAQQIYGSRVSWRRAGLNIGKPWEFQENYRNSRQIARLGLAISSMPYYQGVPDIVQPREPKADGPLPVLALCKSTDNEIETCVRIAVRMCKTQVVGVLLRDRNLDDRITELLNQQGITPIRLHRNISAWTFTPGVYFGTYFSAKGLEFDAVILPFCNEETIPSPSRVIEVGDEAEAKSDEGRLLYVAVTRAKNSLILTYSGELTSLLPSDSSLYDRVSL